MEKIRTTTTAKNGCIRGEFARSKEIESSYKGGGLKLGMNGLHYWLKHFKNQ